jgi:hypothetical protein
MDYLGLDINPNAGIVAGSPSAITLRTRVTFVPHFSGHNNIYNMIIDRASLLSHHAPPHSMA